MRKGQVKEVAGRLNKVLQYLCGEADYKIGRRERILLLWGAVIGLCANGYAYTNYMPKHDALNHMFSSAGEWEVRLGRFFQPYYASLRGSVISPWLVGIIGTAFAVLSALIIVDIVFDYSNKSGLKNDCKNNPAVCEILACGFLTANLCITELCGIYIYIYDCCMIALFFACLSVWCWQNLRQPWNVLSGAVCLAVSLGFYQAFVSVTVVLCAVILLQECLSDRDWKEELRSVLTMAITVIAGALLYLLLYRLMLWHWHTTPTDGNNGMQRLASLSLKEILANVAQSYREVFDFFIGDSRYYGTIVCAMHGLLLLVVLVCFVILLVQRKCKLFNTIAVILLAALLPAFCNITGVIQGEDIVLRSSYGLYLLFPVCLMFVESVAYLPGKKQLQGIVGLICLFLLVRNIQYSNTTYVYAGITYDRTVSIMTRVLDDIETTEGYEAGSTPVAIIGEFSGNDNLAVYEYDRKYINGNNKTSTTYPKTTYNFMESMGSLVNSIEDSDTLKTYAKSEQVKEMPCYPVSGYCQMIDGVLVVKIGD